MNSYAIQFNLQAFTALYPDYTDVTSSPQTYWNTATLYISNRPTFGGLSQAQRAQALNLMAAHLIYLTGIAQGGPSEGQVPGMVTAATIDKVSVSLEPPPGENQWQWWLNLTPYGQQLLALLQVAGVGGLYVSAAPSGRSGFQWGSR